MRLNYQRNPYHLPAQGIHGDCFRTTLSCLLDLEPEAVPLFVDEDDDSWFGSVNRWLAERGLTYIAFEVADTAQFAGLLAFGGREVFHVMQIRAPSGHEHALVGLNGQPYWCPTLGDVRGRTFEVLNIGFLVHTSMNSGCYTQAYGQRPGTHGEPDARKEV